MPRTTTPRASRPVLGSSDREDADGAVPVPDPGAPAAPDCAPGALGAAEGEAEDPEPDPDEGEPEPAPEEVEPDPDESEPDEPGPDEPEPEEPEPCGVSVSDGVVPEEPPSSDWEKGSAYCSSPALCARAGTAGATARRPEARRTVRRRGVLKVLRF